MNAMSEPKARGIICPICGEPNIDNWPVEVDGEIENGGCQNCWEAECDKLWWDTVGAYGRAIDFMREERT